jgi:hypothetical protein
VRSLDVDISCQTLHQKEEVGYSLNINRLQCFLNRGLIAFIDIKEFDLINFLLSKRMFNLKVKIVEYELSDI